MHSLAELTYWEVLAFLMALSGVVCAQLLSGQINTRGLFTGQKGDGTEYFSPELVQLLLFTLGAAFQFDVDGSYSEPESQLEPRCWCI